MLNIRLSRTGKTAQPSFKIVLQEHTSAVKGKFIEELGYFQPTANPVVFKANIERIKYWFSVGAKPSDTMATLLKKEGVEGMEKYIEPRDKHRKKKKEAQAETAAAPAPKAEAPKEEPKQ